MISISHLILIFILISLILFVVVIIQVNKLKYIGIIRSNNEVHQEIKNRLIKVIILFGLTITSGMIFIGLFVLFLTPLDENTLIKEGSQNYILAFIIVIIVVILGVVGTVGLVIMYNRKYSRKPIITPFTERVINLSDFAINYQLDTVKTVGTPVDPLLVIQEGEERVLIRIIGGKFEEKIDITIDQLSPRYSQIDAYALAYDVRIPYGENEYDAIITEVGEINSPRAKIMAQRYILKPGGNNSVEAIGNTMYLGEKTLRIDFKKVNNK